MRHLNFTTLYFLENTHVYTELPVVAPAMFYIVFFFLEQTFKTFFILQCHEVQWPQKVFICTSDIYIFFIYLFYCLGLYKSSTIDEGTGFCSSYWDIIMHTSNQINKTNHHKLRQI